MVDSIRYRWLVSPSKGFVIVVVQQENTNGQKIEVYFQTDINSFWLEFPNTENLHVKIISPKNTESMIRQALHLGWQTDQHESL